MCTRQPELGEMIEYLTAESSLGDLIGYLSIFEDGAEHSFEPEDCGFNQRTAMITNSLFPVLSPDAADHANRLVASQAWSGRVGVPLDLGIVARSDLGACSAPLNCLVDLPLVISAVGRDAVDFPR